MSQILRCEHCKDVIGVYEPMVVLHAGVARHTSRAAEQDESQLAGACYHGSCFSQIRGGSIEQKCLVIGYDRTDGARTSASDVLLSAKLRLLGRAGHAITQRRLR